MKVRKIRLGSLKSRIFIGLFAFFVIFTAVLAFVVGENNIKIAKASGPSNACPGGPLNGGQDHLGANVVISSNTTWQGIHCNIDTLTINNGVSLILDNQTSSVGPWTYVTVEIKANSAIINGTIDGVGKGYGHGTLASSGVGKGPGGGSGFYLGASHGGDGGIKNGNPLSLTNAASYDSLSQPVEPGSGSGSDGATSGTTGGGAGGGAVKISARDGVNVNGSIDVSGEIPASSGVGSGGSIWIDTGVFSGNGNIDASAGQATPGNTWSGSGGGRIAIYYDTNTFTGATQAYGSMVQLPAFNINVSGGAGTIYTKVNSDANGNLRIENPATILSAPNTYIAPTTIFNTDLTSYKDFIFKNANVVVNLPTFNIQNSINQTADVTTSLSVTNTGISFDPGKSLTVNDKVTIITGGLNPLTVDTLTVANGGVLTHQNNFLTKDHQLVINAINVDIQSGGKIDVSGKGFGSTTYINLGCNGKGPGGGIGMYTGNAKMTGAGYGGEGGTTVNADLTKDQLGGLTYGSYNQPNDLGSSGGGDPYNGCIAGGAGGGALKITANNITVNGDIFSNGATRNYLDGVVYTANSGGMGSGGSVWLDAQNISGNGNVQARGQGQLGNGQNGGGGGRIAYYYNSKTFSGTITARGGDAALMYPLNVQNGGAGTIYDKQNSQSLGDLIIDNTGTSPLKESADTILNGTPTFRNVTVTNRAILSHSGNTNTQTNFLELTANNLTVDSSSKIRVDGKGYTGNDGTPDLTGFGPGGGLIQGGGGGHANLGGDKAGAPGTGGPIYGTPTMPTTIGSAGSGSVIDFLGGGGGYVKLRITGTLTNNGGISANGRNANGGTTGGGAAGSLWIIANTITGNGPIETIGGDGSAGAQGYGGGCGAAGYIAIYSPNLGGFSGIVDTKNGIGGGAGTCPVGVPIIQASMPPVAVNDSGSGTLPSNVVVDLPANDTDPDSGLDLTSVTVVTSPLKGNVVINPTTGVATYTPTILSWPVSGTDTFTYTIKDIYGFVSNIATVTINITVAGNVPPIAVNDSGSGTLPSNVVVDLPANDTDSDGTLDLTTVTVGTSPLKGNVSINPTTGVATYTPTILSWPVSGTDTFTYTIKDNLGATSNIATVTISITVSIPPVAVDDIGSGTLPNPIAVNVPANDTDSDGTLDLTSVTIISTPLKGTLSVNPTTGVITYTPTILSWLISGTDTFSYTIKDNSGAVSNLANVTVTVTVPPNVPPVAVNDSGSGTLPSNVVVNLPSNDTDSDGTLDLTSVTVVTPPTKGSVSINPTTGVATYTPTILSWPTTGTDTFTYTIDDNDGDTSNIATVTINITVPPPGSPPTAVNDTATTNMNNSGNFDVLTNDSGATSICVGSLSTPSHGTVVINGNQVLYTPTAGYYGPDSFTYKACNLNGQSNDGTVSVTVVKTYQAIDLKLYKDRPNQDITTGIPIKIQGDIKNPNSFTVDKIETVITIDTTKLNFVSNSASEGTISGTKYSSNVLNLLGLSSIDVNAATTTFQFLSNSQLKVTSLNVASNQTISFVFQANPSANTQNSILGNSNIIDILTNTSVAQSQAQTSITPQGNNLPLFEIIRTGGLNTQLTILGLISGILAIIGIFLFRFRTEDEKKIVFK